MTVSEAIVCSALERRESRGSHYIISDYPDRIHDANDISSMASENKELKKANSSTNVSLSVGGQREKSQNTGKKNFAMQFSKK